MFGGWKWSSVCAKAAPPADALANELELGDIKSCPMASKSNAGGVPPAREDKYGSGSLDGWNPGLFVAELRRNPGEFVPVGSWKSSSLAINMYAAVSKSMLLGAVLCCSSA